MKPIATAVLAFVLMISNTWNVSAFAQGRLNEDAERTFAAAYSELFLFIQQERSCCATAVDPLASWKSSIDQIIAKFKAMKTTGLPQDIVKGWKDLRDKHIAEQEAYKNEIKFLAEVQTENPGLRVDMRREVRTQLPTSRVAEWDSLVTKEDHAESQAVASVIVFDKAWEKYSPPRR